jgi:acyl-coenzyme A synthetase/AMP-(fatty) acid ligase
MMKMRTSLRPTAPLAPPAAMSRWRAHGWLTEGRLGWLLDDAARARPDACALVDAAGDAWTFAQLRDRSHAIAHQLVAAGVGRGDVVSFALPNDMATVAVAAAIWRIGAVANPVVTMYRAHELSFIFAQLDPAVVITARDVRGRDLCSEVDDALRRAGVTPSRLVLGEPPPGWHALADATAEPAPGLGDLEPTAAGDPCLVLYTSGTTADPKGVLHTPAGLLHEVATMQREWGLTYRDTMLMASPLTHITGLLQGLLVPCLVGARAVLMDRWDPDVCLATIERERVTYMAGATPFLRGIVDACARRPAGSPPIALRQYCCGGAAVPPDLVREADALGIAAYRCWGMTELPTATLANERDPLELRATTDGRVADGVEVEAVDAHRDPLPSGTEGELRLRGPERMVGYVDASLNAAALDADGWLYSGDLGTVDDNGVVRITGRLKDVINRGGEKLSAREIEELLLRHPAISDAAVVPLPDERLGEQVCAVLVARDGVAVDDASVRDFLHEQRVAVQKLPARIEWAAELPRTASGKVRKHQLVESLTAHA